MQHAQQPLLVDLTTLNHYLAPATVQLKQALPNINPALAAGIKVLPRTPQMNQKLAGIDTFFLSTSPQYSFLSSSLVREVARFGGDVSGMVPKHVHDRLIERFRAEGA